MNKSYCQWEEKEVKALFSFIEACKQKNLPLTYAFLEYATSTNRKPNSVRNYYYLELEELQKNEARRKELNIDLNVHQKQEFLEFTKEEEYELTYYILQKAREGRSVRSSCLELAKNDVNKMIRYQNKFRSLLKSNNKLIDEINKKLDVTMGPKEEVSRSNIVMFPQEKKNKDKNKLSDDELKSLFMGLVKLVKKSADLEMSSALKKETSHMSENLRKTLIAMRKKEEEIIELTTKNQNLTQKVKELQDQIMKLRINSLQNNFKNKTKNEN